MTHCHQQHKQQKQKNTGRSVTSSRSLVSILVFVGLLVGIAAIFFWFGDDQPRAPLGDATASGRASAVVEPAEIDMGTVEMSKGVTERTFAVKNTGSGPLRIAGLQTSCMCTSAQLEVAGEKSQIFGMAGMGGGHHGSSGEAPKSWAMEIPAGGEGTLRVFYDPNAHGPTGVGSFERIVMFSTNDEAYKNVEVRIRGVVVP